MTLEDDVLRTMQTDSSREWRPRDVHALFNAKTLVQIQYALKKLVEQGAILKRTVGRGVLYRVADTARMPADMRQCAACGGRGMIPVAQLPAERGRRKAAADLLKAGGAGDADAAVDPAELVPLEVNSVELLQPPAQGEGVCQRCAKTSYFTRLLDDGRLLYCCSRGHQMLLTAA